MDRLTSYSHHWEHRVFEKGAPVGDAASIHHHGPTVFGRRLFLTKVSGHDEAGNKVFTWSHRRHRCCLHICLVCKWRALSSAW